MPDDTDASEQSTGGLLGGNKLTDEEARADSEGGGGASWGLNEPWEMPQETGARCHRHEMVRFMTDKLWPYRQWRNM